MLTRQRTLILINVLGGLAVLGSYAHGLAGHPGTRDALWGDVPAALRPLYTFNMLAAAVGYFPFSAFFLLRVLPARPEHTRTVTTSYALMLGSAALWMPLTFHLLDGGAAAGGLWPLIRVVLGITGGSSLGLLVTLVRARPHPRDRGYLLALVGLLFFCLQTAVLDALVWPAYFPR